MRIEINLKQGTGSDFSRFRRPKRCSVGDACMMREMGKQCARRSGTVNWLKLINNSSTISESNIRLIFRTL